MIKTVLWLKCFLIIQKTKILKNLTYLKKNKSKFKNIYLKLLTFSLIVKSNKQIIIKIFFDRIEAI